MGKRHKHTLLQGGHTEGPQTKLTKNKLTVTREDRGGEYWGKEGEGASKGTRIEDVSWAWIMGEGDLSLIHI